MIDSLTLLIPLNRRSLRSAAYALVPSAVLKSNSVLSYFSTVINYYINLQIQWRRRNSPCQYGPNVSDEPLSGVETQDANAVIALQTKLQEKQQQHVLLQYNSSIILEENTRTFCKPSACFSLQFSQNH